MFISPNIHVVTSLMEVVLAQKMGRKLTCAKQVKQLSRLQYLIAFLLDRDNLIPQIITDRHKVMSSIEHAANDDHIYKK